MLLRLLIFKTNSIQSIYCIYILQVIFVLRVFSSSSFLIL
ncbi:unnamed protein product [Brugia timori]|uniref:Uncharacterized protein n=1 Tax=Brugia timori TaxID=42155 RepID=A0A0R3R567_9BILA|nr:unnamed protein product [Brugia timori]